MKKVMFIIVFLLVFSLPVRAEGLYEQSGAQEIEYNLPKDTAEILENEGITPENIAESLDTGGFLQLISEFFSTGLKGVLAFFGSMCSLIIFSSLLNSFATSIKAVDTVFLLCSASLLAGSIYNCIEAAIEALTSVFAFVSASLPVFLGIMITSGKAASATSSGGVILTACQVMSGVITLILAPFMKAYFAVGMCSAFAEQKGINSLMNTVKKAGMWLYSFCLSIFLFLLGAKGAASSYADNLTMKTAQFVLGSTVPVAGPALSESAGAVLTSISMLKGSVGIYIIVAAALIALPLLCSLICYLLSTLLLKGISEVFSCDSLALLLDCAQSLLSVLLGTVLLSLSLLIISMGVMIKL